MNDPILNCITEVCCGRQEAQTLLANTLVDDGVCDQVHAKKCAKWIFDHFDLSPAGTTTLMKKSIAKLARGQSGASPAAE